MIKNRLAACLILLLQTVLVSEYTNDLTFGLVATLVAVLSFFVRYSLTRWLHAILGIAILAANMVAIEMNPPQIMSDWILPGKYVVGVCRALICLQALEMLSSEPEKISNRFAAFAMAGLLAAFCRYQSPYNSTLFFLTAVLASGLVTMLWLPNKKNGESGPAWHKIVSLALLLLSITFGTLYLANGIKYATGFLRYFFVSEYVLVQQSTQVASVAYSATGNLDAIAKFQKVDPNRIALYTKCRVVPGYLRGRVFSVLDSRGWKTKPIDFRANTFERVQGIDGIDSLPEETYSIHSNRSDNGKPFIFVDVRHAPRHVGNIVFTPLNFGYLACNGINVTADEHDVIKQGVNVKESYRSYVSKDQSPIKLDRFYQSQLTQVPKNIQRKIGPLAQQFGTSSSATDAEVIAQVESYFRSNYEYSLESFQAPTLDRISYFILERPASHCEYFATGASVLLRLNGIPTRYVTGFLVEEYDDLDEWLARNEDAHAWVEAYDRQKKKWVVVEATPGIDARKNLWDENETAIKMAESNRSRDNQSNSNMRFFIEYTRYLFRNYLQGAVNVFISVLLISVLYWMYRSRVPQHQNAYQLKKYAREMKKLEKRLRRIDLSRQPSETLHQFADRIRQDAQAPEWAEEGAQFILKYANLRYQ